MTDAERQAIIDHYLDEAIPTGSSTSSGSIVIANDNIFTTTTARDTYFSANPTKLITNMYIMVGTGYQQYIGGVWKDVSTVLKGSTGDTGATGTAATVTVGSVVTGATGSEATVTDSGTPSNAVLNFSIPRGERGIQGLTGASGINWRGTYAPATAYVANDAVGYNGSSFYCTASTTGNLPTNTAYWQPLSLMGATGAAGADGVSATVSIGTVTTGTAGSTATVSNSGTATAAKFDFAIPQGAKGDKGDPGDASTLATTTVAGVVKLATATPVVDSGSGTVGTSTAVAKEDHAHPIDATRAPLASPNLTGTPTAPTATVDTSTTQIATTAFVVGQASTVAPLANGTATVGTSTKYAREGHVHPTTPLSYLKAYATNQQTSNLSAGGIIAVNATELNVGTKFSFANNKITIAPTSNVVKVTVNIAMANFSSGGHFYYQIYNETTASFVGKQCGVDAVTSTSSTFGSLNTSYSFIPTVTTVIDAKVVGSNSATGITGVFIEVQEIPLVY